jgi:hypothetical protein
MKSNLEKNQNTGHKVYETLKMGKILEPRSLQTKEHA